MSDKLMHKFEKPTRPRLREEEIERIIDMKNAGMANRDIEKSLHRAKETIRRAVNKYWRGKPMPSADVCEHAMETASITPKLTIDTGSVIPMESLCERNMPGSMQQESITILGRHGKYQIEMDGDETGITFTNKSNGMVFVDANDIDVLIDELDWLKHTYMQPKNS
jgi:hypothetical protein